jgi:PHD/YefM family antitoxin component YafN of YafNO toxin-antitoxin module
MPSGRFIGAGELHKTATLLRDISASGETCYITEDGKAKAVLMDINRYNALMDLLEESESPHSSDEKHQAFSVRSIIKNRIANRT